MSTKKKQKPEIIIDEAATKPVRMAYGGHRMNGDDVSVAFFSGKNYSTIHYFTPGKTFSGFFVGQVIDIPSDDKVYQFHKAVRVPKDDAGISEETIDDWRVTDAGVRAVINEKKHLKEMEDLHHMSLDQLAGRLRYMKSRERNALLRQIMMFLMGEAFKSKREG